MKVEEQKGGIFMGYFQRCLIKFDYFVKNLFLKKWKR